MAERPAIREGPQNLKKKSVEADLRTFTKKHYLPPSILPTNQHIIDYTMATPVQRRSSRLAQRRCSLQSLSVEDEEAAKQQKQQYLGRSKSSRTAQTNEQKQQQQPLRRSKRIIEQNTKSQSLLLPPSPVSALDAPFSTSTATDDQSESGVLPDIKASSIITPIKIKTPSKSQGVRFGINSVAEFSGCDPPMRMDRLSSDVSQHLFPHRSNSNDDDDGSDDDDVTKQNCHILAQWDDSFDELGQIDDEDEEDSITDHYHDEDGNEEETQWRNATLVLEEEEEIVDVHAADITQNDNHRYKEERSRPTKRVDEYFCKTCGKGMRYTSRFVYEDD